MKFSKKIIIILLFVIGIAGLLVGSIAYYRIVVNGSITGSTGNAVFVLRDTEAGESWNNKVISLGKINPGDSGSFDVVMDASGSTVDMYATLNIDRGSGDTELPTNLKFYTTSDHKSELHKYYSFLEKSGTNKEKLTIYWYWNPYIDDNEDFNYMNRNISATINVTAVQVSEYATMSEFSTNKAFWKEKYIPYVRTINFSNDLSNLPSSCTETNLCWDISFDSSQKKKVYGYLVDTGLKDSIDNTKSLYNLYIVSKAPIFAPADSSSMFSFNKYSVEHNKYISNLISINFNNNFNTSNVTSMFNMFNHCTALTTLDLSSFNIVNVTNMSGMFYACESLTSLDLSNFNTANVKNMDMMFCNCTSLTSLDFSSFNTSKLEYMAGMFSDCSSLTSLDLSNFNTSNVTGMNNMFKNCSSLTSLDLGSFNTAKVTSMGGMFYRCTSLRSLNLSNFNTTNVEDMSTMFNGCVSLTILDLSNFNTANVTDMDGMFSCCESLTSLDLNNFNTANVTRMNSMFEDCVNLTSLDLSSFTTANVTNMSYMFHDCSSLATQINIMNPNIKDYSNMFQGAATASGSQITVNYIASASTLVDKMIATKSTNSNVIKGKQI